MNDARPHPLEQNKSKIIIKGESGYFLIDYNSDISSKVWSNIPEIVENNITYLCLC